MPCRRLTTARQGGKLISFPEIHSTLDGNPGSAFEANKVVPGLCRAAATRRKRLVAVPMRQTASPITRAVPSLGHGHRCVTWSVNVMGCVTALKDR